jgi:hypothetical protein
MKLRAVCLGLGLLSIAATGDPCDDTNSSGTITTNVGQNGAVCGVTVNTPCCGNAGDPCSDNNDCCTGNCGGSPDGGFASDGGSVCSEPINEGCSAALSSRCNTGECACASDTDCCLGNCVKAAIPGTTGLRCCLESGQPCDAPADCCSLTCGESNQCE